MINSSSTNGVLIVGAGPTGLVLALWLTRLGIPVRVIDTTAKPGTTSRALAVQARTLELYSQIGLAATVVDRGHRVGAVNLWASGRRSARAPFGELGKGLSPYPFALIFPQDEHERLLIEELTRLGIEVERRCELLSFDEGPTGVMARLKKADGSSELLETSYIAGCDGAHSTVRSALGIGFQGGTYDHLFYVADVRGRGAVMNGELHVGLDKTDFLAVFPLKAGGHARLVGTVREGAGQTGGTLSWNDVSKHVLKWFPVEVQDVNWFSTYHVHHRVADHFRKGRAFLLGDAAHIHSPVGGQGMNTGIGDAINLAWKLSAVLLGSAHESILDTYEPERIAFARRLVDTTDRAFTAATSPGTLARLIRLRLVPFVMPLLFKFGAVRRLMFRTVSQTALDYRHSSLSAGRAGGIHGGDRLPWVDGQGEEDNFASLTTLGWQAHVYGEASAALAAACAERRLPLRVFAWRASMTSTGLERGALLLVRPDGYVALADARGDAAALRRYFNERQLT